MLKTAFSDRREYLRLDFGPADGASFHYFWLRQHCPCCVHPDTGERVLGPAAVDLDIRPRHIEATPGGILLHWPDGHRSAFDLDWLRRHRYAEDEPPAVDGGDLGHIQVDYGDCANDPVTVCRQYLKDRGAILVRGCPLGPETLVERFTGRGFGVRSTHFGYIEDLRTDNTTNKNTDQLGYTNAAVELHTDQPFIDDPPRYQLLLCMRPAASGGENMVADASRAAAYLRALDRDAFEALSGTPVLFHRRQKAFESKVTCPILRYQGGDFAQVRSSYFTYAPLDLPFDRMEAWYRAYQKFTRLTENPAYQYRFLLQKGDFVLYDNYRMLHGRTAFSGSRWMKGIYFDYPARAQATDAAADGPAE